MCRPSIATGRGLTWAMLALLVGCEGPRGPAGPPGLVPDAGFSSTDGAVAADGGAPGDAAACSQAATPGLSATVAVSSPANGMFFAAGEKPILTIRLTDRCGRVLGPADVSTANLYVWGPRQLTAEKTAASLLNCVTDRTAADHQHHFINLAKPSYADSSKPAALTFGADGVMSFTLQSISDEPAGSYTAGVWAKDSGDVEQVFPLADFQIGTATVEPLTGGSPATCLACHQAPSGITYMHHIHPQAPFAPVGNFSLDQMPIGDCLACHNNDGYSPNPIVRKVHGLHRGKKQLAPGVAHPDYGLATDATLTAYLNVGYPVFPDGDKDCASCHNDDRWKSQPSRLACGTCHDNLFFDTGQLTPPRDLGKPASASCVSDGDCASFVNGATCNIASGHCERKTHPTQSSDAQCLTCHADGAIAPTSAAHEIVTRTRTPGLKIVGLQLSGGSGAGGAFAVGDIPTASFSLVDKTGTAITTVASNAAFSANAIVAGPTNGPQRVLGPLSLKAPALTVDAMGVYHYALPALPAAAQSPYNTTTPGLVNVPGTYTVFVWIYESVPAPGGSARDEGVASQSFSLGTSGPTRPRQVITTAACNSCHVNIQAHGGSRQQDANLCWTCHNAGAVDRTVGATASPPKPCTTSASCQSFETCATTPTSGTATVCQVAVDPTPNTSIAYPALIHNIHFGRLRGGYAESGNLNPGKLQYLGFGNSLNDFSEVLLPLDVRNCQKCHADSGAMCSATMPCGEGQSCAGGKCVNTAWVQPSGRACLTCHDQADAFAHVGVNTWMSPSGPVESCGVCHGAGDTFSVEKVHNVWSPFVPPYSREAAAP